MTRILGPDLVLYSTTMWAKALGSFSKVSIAILTQSAKEVKMLHWKSVMICSLSMR